MVGGEGGYVHVLTVSLIDLFRLEPVSLLIVYVHIQHSISS